ncbi:MAG: hypothetical protein EF806_01925 [Candidatus Methanoliparum thermophilum]|uniref:SAM-dependent chlorinase/fluorinase n=1 Tax=Methanoliparum thermophilum TaxID=2491083 RepID=A0A520KSD2_METT2|nr:MAG: hypothetical protein EF806_01925 [Candidatus Methanoliparum thermophilum]
MKKIISLLTDFGTFYPAIMKGVIFKINPDVEIIDITHSVNRIKEGAFLLRSCINYFPDGTIFVVVVDPGVGSRRNILIVDGKIDNSPKILIGPDNGILSLAIAEMDSYKVYQAFNKKYFLKDVSRSFHGRDIFAPIAAHISKGVSIDEIGKTCSKFEKLDIFLKINSREIIGEVLYIDDFGDIITSIPNNLINDIKTVEFNDRKINIYDTYSDVKKGDLLVLKGSHGRVELAMNAGNAAKFLGIDIEDKVTLKVINAYS